MSLDLFCISLALLCISSDLFATLALPAHGQDFHLPAFEQDFNLSAFGRTSICLHLAGLPFACIWQDFHLPAFGRTSICLPLAGLQFACIWTGLPFVCIVQDFHLPAFGRTLIFVAFDRTSIYTYLSSQYFSSTHTLPPFFFLLCISNYIELPGNRKKKYCAALFNTIP